MSGWSSDGYAEVKVPNVAGVQQDALRLYDGRWSGQWWVSLGGQIVAQGSATSPEAGRGEAVRAARLVLQRLADRASLLLDVATAVDS